MKLEAWLTVREAAGLLDVSPSQVRGYLKRKRLRGKRLAPGTLDPGHDLRGRPVSIIVFRPDVVALKAERTKRRRYYTHKSAA